MNSSCQEAMNNVKFEPNMIGSVSMVNLGIIGFVSIDKCSLINASKNL